MQKETTKEKPIFKNKILCLAYGLFSACEYWQLGIMFSTCPNWGRYLGKGFGYSSLVRVPVCR